MTFTINKLSKDPAADAGKLPAKTLAAKAAQQILLSNPLVKLAHEIENLADEDAAHKKVTGVMLHHAQNYFELGGVLARIKSEGWFGQHASFADYCVDELGFSQSKGYYLIGIYRTLLDLEVSWDAVKVVGWSKLALLCAKRMSKVIDEHEFSNRLEEAKTKTFKELAAELKVPGPGTKAVAKIVLKPHPDQKEVFDQAVQKMKDELPTNHDTVAFEHICLDYLSGTKVQPSGAYALEMLKTMMAVLGPEKTLSAFDDQFPDWKVMASVAGE